MNTPALMIGLVGLIILYAAIKNQSPIAVIKSVLVNPSPAPGAKTP